MISSMHTFQTPSWLSSSALLSSRVRDACDGVSREKSIARQSTDRLPYFFTECISFRRRDSRSAPKKRSRKRNTNADWVRSRHYPQCRLSDAVCPSHMAHNRCCYCYFKRSQSSPACNLRTCVRPHLCHLRATEQQVGTLFSKRRWKTFALPKQLLIGGLLRCRKAKSHHFFVVGKSTAFIREHVAYFVSKIY